MKSFFMFICIFCSARVFAEGPAYASYDVFVHQLAVCVRLPSDQPNTFEYTLHTLIDNHIELDAFYDSYRNGGRRAYDPAILLKIALFAYSKGITSSREIQ